MKQISRVGLTISILLLSFTLTSNGQGTPIDMEVFLKPINSVGAKDSANAIYNVVFAIKLTDTVDVSNIHVKLGDTPGGGEKASHVVPMDPQGNLPTGVTCKHKNKTVYIGLGPHSNMENYHAEVQTEDKNGNKSAIVKPIK